MRLKFQGLLVRLSRMSCSSSHLYHSLHVSALLSSVQLNFQAHCLHMIGSMAAPDSLILIAGDPGRRQKLFLILLIKGHEKTLIGPAQAGGPFSN